MGETIDTLIRELVEAHKEHNRRNELHEAAMSRWQQTGKDAHAALAAVNAAQERLDAAIRARAEG